MTKYKVKIKKKLMIIEFPDPDLLPLNISNEELKSIKIVTSKKKKKKIKFYDDVLTADKICCF